MDDKKYWENFYTNHKEPYKNTLFAEFCLSNYFKPSTNLLELGCGNGRDAIYFAKSGLKVLAVDQCVDEINYLNDNYSSDNLIFKTSNFANIKTSIKFNYIYSRFTMHAIDEKSENIIISSLPKYLKKNGMFLMEARGTKNEYFGKGTALKDHKNVYLYENHYRRFIEMNEFCKKLELNNMKVIFAREESGFAPFGDTDYKYIRVISVKK